MATSGPSAPSTPSPTNVKKHYRDLPANEFISKIKHFSSELVTIRVSGRDFRLPKDLLCHNSTYFDEKLNKDGQGTRLENIAHDLPYGSSETFELVVQWMYMSDIVLPSQTQIQPRVKIDETPNKQGKVEKSPRNPKAPVLDLTTSGTKVSVASEEMIRKRKAASSAITSYVSFFILAHQISLLGPFDVIIAKVRSLLCLSVTVLSGDRIRTAATQLPKGHAIRKLFAQACVRMYINSIDTPTHRIGFPLNVEMAESEGFAADLFCEVDETLRRRKREKDGSIVYTSPLSGSEFKLQNGL